MNIYKELLFSESAIKTAIDFNSAQDFINNNTSLKTFDKRKTDYFYALVTEGTNDIFIKTFDLWDIFDNQNNHWEYYKQIFLHDNFLSKMVTDSNKNYLLKVGECISEEEEFKKYFISLLNNPNSILYHEIQSCTRLEDIINHELLNLLFATRLTDFFHFGLINIFSFHIDNYLSKRRGVKCIYTEEYTTQENIDSTKLVKLLRFIKLFYSHLIKENIDITTLSTKRTNRQSIYYAIINSIISNIDESIEVETNYNRISKRWSN
jgi:hypothetical protein